MAVYIGVDFHARQQTISYLTTEEGEIKGLELDYGEPAKVRKFYKQFVGQQVVVGFESSGYAAWFEELLEELGYESGLAMPPRFVRLRAVVRRTIDATRI